MQWIHSSISTYGPVYGCCGPAGCRQVRRKNMHQGICNRAVEPVRNNLDSRVCGESSVPQLSGTQVQAAWHRAHRWLHNVPALATALQKGGNPYVSIHTLATLTYCGRCWLLWQPRHDFVVEVWPQVFKQPHAQLWAHVRKQTGKAV